ncbi:MAG: zinc ribbon domain-containing protein [Desulfarculaceae bacterium]|nr:zinc ribbon domain-containing protein [Desulfarculaceae bacterium]MCF8071477.1 zinc ribbon domain-containing protein [Desulfarculaceae bacterium]MCF8103395.1 zinc ribbon domain-containing protein [Desulfarculaceae bacterium]MCF8118055.1 zinc ribbon domain-containing protein [Desulfarculaceae bacterium]
MPLFDIRCADCGFSGETLVMDTGSPLACPSCGGSQVEKLMSAPSSLSGGRSERLPGAGDTSCCGSNPGAAGCAGPGSCCGRG